MAMDALSFFHTWTKNDAHMPVPFTRMENALFVTGNAIKPQMVTRLLLKHLYETEKPEKVIRSGISAGARVDAEREFNRDPSILVCICSSRSCQESMNLQNGSHVQIICDQISYASILQCLGRSHRLGQLFKVLIYVLVVDGTIDQALQATYFKRHCGTVASQTRIDEQHAAKLLRHMPAEMRARMRRVVAADKTVGSNECDYVIAMVREPYAEAVIRELFGVRSSRTGDWADAKDFGQKNMLPSEVIFRIACGGCTANDTVAQLVERDTPKPEQPGKSNLTRAGNSNPMAPLSFVKLSAKPFNNDVAISYLTQAAEELSGEVAYRLNNIRPLGTYIFTLEHG